MRFRPEMAGVTAIISAIPPDSTRKGKDDAHGGNPEVRAGHWEEPGGVRWCGFRRSNDPAYNGQRRFGCTGGHVHWNWAQDDFRKTILNSIVWIAKVDVPANGVESKRPTVADMVANMDSVQKKHEVSAKDEAFVGKFIEDVNKPVAAK